MSIEIEGLTKRFGRTAAVDDVTLSLSGGELVALLGPSGSGKTTLLRLIAGLELPEAGRILLHGRDVTELGARERRIGFVFQHYALFRHMTVFDNVAFGLRSRPRRARPDEATIRQTVERLLSLVQLDWTAKRFPSQLSGGQRQRIALARALAIEPNVLLLDEPFGALDAKVRKELRGWLRRLHEELHITSVFVTHDQEEALELADRVVLLNEGRVVQVGSPREVCEQPANDFVYDFVGLSNLVRLGRDAQGRRRLLPDGEEGGELLRLRPHELKLLPAEDGAAELQVWVRQVVAGTGLAVRVGLAAAEEGPILLEAETTRETLRALRLHPGLRVGLALPESTRAG